LNSNQTIYIRPGLSLCVVREWLSSEDEQALLDALYAELTWMQGEIRLFGRSVAEPRFTAWCGDVSYTYSKRVLQERAWHPRLRELRHQLEGWLEANAIATPHNLNHCLLNYYRSGQDSMGGIVTMNQSSAHSLSLSHCPLAHRVGSDYGKKTMMRFPLSHLNWGTEIW